MVAAVVASCADRAERTATALSVDSRGNLLDAARVLKALPSGPAAEKSAWKTRQQLEHAREIAASENDGACTKLELLRLA
jgi:hypothetical protein